MATIRCPNPDCTGRIMHKSQGGPGHVVRVRGPLMIDDAGQAHGKCQWCKSTIPLPLSVAVEPTPARRRYVIQTNIPEQT